MITTFLLSGTFFQPPTSSLPLFQPAIFFDLQLNLCLYTFLGEVFLLAQVMGGQRDTAAACTVCVELAQAHGWGKEKKSEGGSGEGGAPGALRGYQVISSLTWSSPHLPVPLFKAQLGAITPFLTQVRTCLSLTCLRYRPQCAGNWRLRVPVLVHLQLWLCPWLLEALVPYLDGPWLGAAEFLLCCSKTLFLPFLLGPFPYHPLSFI